MLKVAGAEDDIVRTGVFVAVRWSAVWLVVTHSAWRSHIVCIFRSRVRVVNHKIAMSHFVDVRSSRMINCRSVLRVVRVMIMPEPWRLLLFLRP